MKFEISEDDYIIYINKNLYDIDLNNKEEIESYIKELIVKLKDIYHEILTGSYKVNIFENRNMGLIIEIKKQEEFNLFRDLIDLKINIYRNSEVYLEFSDYFLISDYFDIYTYKDKYYININLFTSKKRLLLSEFYKYVYGSRLDNLKPKLKKVENN